MPEILNRGAAWYKALCLGNPKSTGTKLFSVCGHVVRPGNYEITMGFPMKDLIYDLAGGMRPGRTLKAVELISVDIVIPLPPVATICSSLLPGAFPL